MVNFLGVRKLIYASVYTTCQKWKGIPCNKSHSLNVRELKCDAEHVQLCGSESSNVNKQIKNMEAAKILILI